MAIRTLSICSGIGGLDLGLRFACPDARTVCYVERDAYAASVLVARMESEALDRAPVWSDLLTFPCELFRRRVDLVVGGIPCQPYSAAGKALGAEDGRDLWPATLRLLRDLGARALFLENVSRFATNPDGLRRVLKDLAAMGWDAEWGVFSCGALGAPHRRERLFLLAYADGFGLRLKSGGSGGKNGSPATLVGHNGASLGNADGLGGRQEQPSRNNGHRATTGREEGTNRSQQPGQELADASGESATGRRPPERRLDHAESALLRQGLADPESLGHGPGIWGFSQEPCPTGLDRLWPPGQEPDRWRDIDARFRPAAPKHDLRRVADGVPAWVVESNRYRVDRLRCLGNAVSPPVAAVAWHELTRRALA